jgi:hypothetical protein
MEQSITAANTKTEVFKNRVLSLEDELYRARVSRIGFETELFNVRRRSNSYNQGDCSVRLSHAVTEGDGRREERIFRSLNRAQENARGTIGG